MPFDSLYKIGSHKLRSRNNEGENVIRLGMSLFHTEIDALHRNRSIV